MAVQRFKKSDGTWEVIGGGTGTGEGASMLEIRYNFDGTELTDEDKAINAATYSALKSDSILYAKSNVGTLIASAVTLPTESEPYMTVVFDADVLSTIGNNKVILLIGADGNIVYSLPISDAKEISFANVTDWQSLVEAFANVGIDLNSEYATISGIHISLGFQDETGFIYDGMVVQGICLFTYISGGTTLTVSASRSANAVEVKFSLGGALIISDSATEQNTYFDRYSKGFTILLDEHYYAPIEIKESSTGIMEFVIYHNGSFETYRLNSDGSTSKL